MMFIIETIFQGILKFFIDRILRDFGNIKIYTKCIEIIYTSLYKKEYVLECNIFNKKSLPTIIKNLHAKMTLKGMKGFINVNIYQAEEDKITDLMNSKWVNLGRSNEISEKKLPAKDFCKINLAFTVEKEDFPEEIMQYCKIKLYYSNEKNYRKNCTLYNGYKLIRKNRNRYKKLLKKIENETSA